ncbi:MAG: TolC family protein [Gemmatimonadota bacterium]
MQRTLWIVAWSLALGALNPGVPLAAAQANHPGRPQEAPRDTLTLTLSEAHRRALALNPEHLADRQQIDIANGQLTQARTYAFNPELEVQAPGVGAGGALREYELSFIQEIEWAGQRGLRVRAARSGADLAAAAVHNSARQILADVSYAFYGTLAAEQRLGVARELVQLNEELVTITRIQAREGEISVMDANLAEIEAGRARAAVLAAEREQTTARLQLQRLLGLGPEQPLRIRDDVPAAPSPSNLNPDSLVAFALARRPDLAAGTRALEQAETLVRLARREAIPNVRLSLFVERDGANRTAPDISGAPSLGSRLESPRVGLGVSLALPIFQRNQGLIDERAAQGEQARLAREASELTVRTEVVNAYQAYRAASEETRVFEQDVLEPARANQRLLETALRAGKVGLPTLLLLRNQLLDAELSYWDAWLEQRWALVDLSVATATMSTDLNNNPLEAR